MTSRSARSAGCRVLLLDDAPHLSVAAHDATVAVRVIEQHRQQADATAGGDQQAFERGRRHERHVAVEHQRVRAVGKVRKRLHHRVPGAELRLLQHKDHVALRGKRRAHRLGAMADDDHDARIGLARGNDARSVDDVR